MLENLQPHHITLHVRGLIEPFMTLLKTLPKSQKPNWPAHVDTLV